MKGPLALVGSKETLVLSCLRLKNIALIDSIELEFTKGFTVLTGETGAGKSLLIDALDALLGGFQSSSGIRLIREGEEHAHIEAEFFINNALEAWLLDQSFDNEQPELLVSREWRKKDNRWISRSRLNGEIVNRNQLLALRDLLLDFTIQGQAHQLALPHQQLSFLDRLGSCKFKTLLDKVRRNWMVWKKNYDALLLEKSSKELQEKDLFYFKTFLEELEFANLDDIYEDKNLINEQNKLVNGVSLKQGLSTILSCLHEGQNEIPSMVDQLNLCISQIQVLIKSDSTLKSSLDKIFDINEDVQGLINQLQQYGSTLDSQPERLSEVQDRISFLNRLKQKYHLDLPGLIKKRDELRNLLDINLFNSSLDQLQHKESESRLERDSINKELSAARKQLSLELEQGLLKHLKPLGLEHINFKVDISSREPSVDGADQIRFLFSANPGLALSPLADIASGGEMSRFFLALKVIFAQLNHSSTFIFDEIDSGVSGRISGKIAKEIKLLSKTNQVFCVTHQPLIASAADHHFVIRKSVEAGKTKSSVFLLENNDERKNELVEMAGGNIADAGIYAESLLEHHAA